MKATHWSQLLGIPWEEMHCHALATAACLTFGRRLPPLGEDLVELGCAGEDVRESIPQLEVIDVAAVQPGDVLLCGPAGSDAVTGVATVVYRGLVLITDRCQLAHAARIEALGRKVKGARRPPPC